ncbi:MAG: DUF4105 domain-containing protein [Muribaculaceae bacterium]
MTILIVMALSWLCVFSLNAVPSRTLASDAGNYSRPADSLRVSFITCYPGPEIYELYGHEAIRIRSNTMDSVWNFGIFDFREPNFVYRFVKGETDYMVAGYPFEWFMPEYVARGSRVVEQELNLTQAEAMDMLSRLRTLTLPENRRYRYNYVKNNCATRIICLLDSVASARVVYPDSVRYATFREEMRAYNRNYPWYQFGIDIALGSGIDYPLKAKEEMFVPVEMLRMTGAARLADGRHLVGRENILYEGRGDMTLSPTPWYAGPMFWSLVMLAASAAFFVYSLWSRKIVKTVYSLWYFLQGVAGLLVAFLVFISVHEATSPNTLILWLNPLQLLMAMAVWWKKTRPVAIAMAYYNMVAMVCMFVVWPFQHQSANPAFFPLMGCNLLMSLAYAIIAGKESYINNRLVDSATSSRKKAGGSASGKRKSPTKRQRKTTAE